MKLEIKNLSKSYGKTKALLNFQMEFNPGVYGLLGSNGAGKSTLMNLITDNISRDEGEILYNGRDIIGLGKEFRKEVGYMPQQQGFYDYFTVETFLLYVAYLKKIPSKQSKSEINQLLGVMNLETLRRRKMKALSGGMKQRVLLAQALLGSPSILILDEPTAGLDPKERIRIRNLISDLSKDKLILLATHVVSDVECIADQVVLLRQGRTILVGTPSELIASLKGHVGEILCTKQELEGLQKIYPVGNVIQRKEGIAFRIVGDTLPDEARMIENDIGLEDVYLYYLDYLKIE